MSRLSRGLAGAPILLYRAVISPWTGNQCRFHPTCSAYALEAIERHGAVRGLILASCRLACCQPWSKRPGLDPVPETFSLRFACRRLLRYKRTDKSQ